MALNEFVWVAVAVYSAVLVAELIGDKTIYTVTSLTMRVRMGAVLAGMVLAYAAKMTVAVLLGSAVARLQSNLVTIISAGAFFVSALMIGFCGEEEIEVDHATWPRSITACFASLFLTEWGDPGQIVAAASSVRFHMPFAVWLAGTLAMTTKGVLAMFVGVKLRGRLPQRMLRTVGALSLGVLGAITLAQAVRAG